MLPFSWRRFLAILAALFVINWAIVQLVAPPKERISVPYSPTFVNQVKAGNVKEISAEGDTVQGEFKKEVSWEGDKSTDFKTEIPSFANDNALTKLLEDNDVVVNAEPPGERSLLETILFSFGPTILLVALFIWLFRRAAAGAGGGGVLGQFGRSRAKRVESSEQTVTFADVAGIDDAKEELVEVVDFLKNPAKYQKLGARIPRGVLLSGPPGTGKTLLARAVAGEANVPFYSASASEFIEAIVGVGASRVRDLFKQAEEAAPAIIFIDELDAIGGARGRGGTLGGHDEREQTLNQILTEMDGFDPNVGVIVLAATNRPDVLDPALLRPGRFDRQVVVPFPDVVGREKILRVHCRKVPLAPDVDLRVIARGTPGFSGADLANIVNEAALLAARRSKRIVTQHEFEDAKDKVMMGAERRSMVMTEEEKALTAYHEAGHAIVGMNMPSHDPIHKATIIPRGRTLGMVLSLPERDRHGYTREFCISRLAMAFGGREAEILKFGPEKVTNGATGDIQQATRLARAMIMEWGMSDKLGRVRYQGNEQEVFLGHSVTQSNNMSEETAKLIDAEVRQLIEDGEATARRILLEKREQWEIIAQGLLEYETLSGDEIIGLLNGKKPVRDFTTNDDKPSRPSSAVPAAGKGRRTQEPDTGGMEPQPL